MIAFRFDIGVHDLIVEKLRGLRLAGNAPAVIIQQPAEKRELPLPVQDLDLHKVSELSNECPHALVKTRQIALNLRSQQGLHGAVGELRLKFTNGSGGIAKELA